MINFFYNSTYIFYFYFYLYFYFYFYFYFYEQTHEYCMELWVVMLYVILILQKKVYKKEDTFYGPVKLRINFHTVITVISKSSERWVKNQDIKENLKKLAASLDHKKAIKKQNFSIIFD